jgi:hypothetical protein
VEDLNIESNFQTSQAKVKAEAKKLSSPVTQINKANAVSKQKTEPLAGLVAEVSAALSACRKVPKVSSEALKDDWVRVDLLGGVLKRINPLLDLQNYGMPKKRLSRCLEHPYIKPYFEIKVVNNIKFLRNKSQANEANSGQVLKQDTELLPDWSQRIDTYSNAFKINARSEGQS